MKKLLAAGLALTMSLSLTACMGGTANQFRRLQRL